MHFETREDYVMWATVMLLQAADMMTDSNALENAVRNAQKAADYFFGPAQKRDSKGGKNPFTDPPEIRKPPQVQVAGPAIPGDRANVPTENPNQS